MPKQSTLVLKGMFKDGVFQIKINQKEEVSESPCVRTGLRQTFVDLKRKTEETKRALCFDELLSENVTKDLRYWLKKKGMMFFLWRGYNDQMCIFITPFASTSFEVDELLEELLDLAIIDTKLRTCSGTKEDLATYEVSRVFGNALEVVGQHAHSHSLHIGYAGIGANLCDAIREVSALITR